MTLRKGWVLAALSAAVIATGAMAQMVPQDNGTLVYLFTGDDLAPVLARVPAAGGTVAMPRTSIGEHGFIALFIDSEGNRVGLHSLH